jgi:hypothetical protein
MATVTVILKVGHPKITSTQISDLKRNKLAEKNLTEKPRIYVKLIIAM